MSEIFSKKNRNGKNDTLTADAPRPKRVKAPAKNDAPARATIPDRYSIKEDNDGRTLTCFESPNLSVQIERGLVASAASARKFPSGTIFLDGAAQGAPFLEHERQLYNLDHHEGCIRAFTLATCEQAMVMLMKGLDLRKQQWRIIANEPDLDTVMAVWTLLNHFRLRDPESRARKAVMPLLRLEGAIDAHGLDMIEFTGFPEELLQKSMKTLESLRTEEKRIKMEGRWDEVDYLAYTAGVMRKLDQIIYRPREFSDFQEIEELTQLAIYNNKIAVVCTSDTGIYETEQQLKRLYGTRLALILLQKDNRTYTIRQTDLFLPSSLEDIYEKLNIYDPAVTARRPENRWGGSTDIGGSPRRTGTQLQPEEILEISREAFNKPDTGHYIKNALRAAALAAGTVALGWASRYFWDPLRWLGEKIPDFLASSTFGFMLPVGITTFGVLMFLNMRRNRIKTLGIQVPAGRDWLSLFPLAIILGVAGGAWAPWIHPIRESMLTSLSHILVLPLLAELLFRGLVHGLQITGSRIQTRESAWFVSWPVLVSGILFGLTALLPLNPFVHVLQPVAEGLELTGAWRDWFIMGARLFSATALGITLGIIRERSESLLASYMAHLISVVVILTIIQYSAGG